MQQRTGWLAAVSKSALLTAAVGFLAGLAGCSSAGSSSEPGTEPGTEGTQSPGGKADMPGSAQDGSGKVKLLSAHLNTRKEQGAGGSCPCGRYGWVTGYIEVEGTSGDKQVAVRYHSTTSADSEWPEVQASYVGPGQGGRQIWAFQTPEVYSSRGAGFKFADDFAFAIRYRSGGKDVWDNNNAWNYCVGANGPYGCHSAALGASNVTLSSAVYWNQFQGRILLKNLAYEKTVKVIYTEDNGVTTQEVQATYEGPGFGQDEFWTFSAPIAAAAPGVKFHIQYQTQGKTYSDDNVGNEYVMGASAPVWLFTLPEDTY